MPHKNEYLPFFKVDACLRETITKETRAIAKRPVYKGLTEEHRKEAIAALNPLIRPRSLLGEQPPPMVSISAAATMESDLGRSCATVTGSWEAALGGGSPKTEKRLQFNGLRGRPELNGVACEVVDGTPDRAGRITVRLSSESPGAPAGKLMRIRASRLSEDSGGSAGGRTAQLQKAMSMGDLSSADSPTLRPLPVPKCRRSFSRKPGGGYFNHSLGQELYNSPFV